MACTMYGESKRTAIFRYLKIFNHLCVSINKITEVDLQAVICELSSVTDPQRALNFVVLRPNPWVEWKATEQPQNSLLISRQHQPFGCLNIVA